MRKILIALSMLVLCGCITSEILPYTQSEMEDKTEALAFTASNGVVLPYRLYVSDFSSWNPLVVVLHGAGERGSDNVKQLSYGIAHIAKFVDENVETATIIAPQCPNECYWKSESITLALHELVTEYRSKPFVNGKRVYVTGYSMGAEGAFVYSLRYPDDVTTIVTLCAGPLVGDPYSDTNVDERFRGKNVWSVNYFDDTFVDNTYSKFVISKIWALNTNNVHYTELLTGGHTTEMYNSRKLMQWMFGTK